MYCVLSIFYCFYKVRGCFVNLVGRGSSIMGHGSVFCVGQWVMGHCLRPVVYTACRAGCM